MKLGFLAPAIDDIDKAARLGFDGIELQSAAFGQEPDGRSDPDLVAEGRRRCERCGIEITAIAYYGLARSAMSPPETLAAYQRVFDLAEALRVRTVASMSGFDASRDWNGNLQLFADRFGPVAEEAERRGLRIAFENWMGFGGHLPFLPVNMGGSPETWESWFRLVPSAALGLEFDPSHLYWQGIDHLRALKEFSDRVYHVHAKDTELLPEVRYRVGVNGKSYRFRIPGYGEINWARFVAALVEIGYSGGVAIEHEDPVFTGERFDEGLRRGWQTLHPLTHPGGGVTA
jgi:sugar phosphate isomerase/epimerase